MRSLPEAAERGLFAALFASVAEEMLAALVRSAFSPNIKERRDASTALFAADGSLVAQAAAIPVHLGALPLSVAAALQTCGPLAEGDVILLNDPYAGGTHLPDLTMVSPVAGHGGKPLAYLASRAHHADVGGMTPGSMPLARSIDEEGLRIPPVRLVEGGSHCDDVWRRILDHVRTPDERKGDLRAQLAAHAVGAARVGQAVERYGADALQARMAILMAYGERLMRAALSGIPDGAYAFADTLDGDGTGSGPIPIRVSIEIDGDRARADFTGSAPACAGNLNAVEAVTRSAVAYAFQCVLADRLGGGDDTQSELPINAGSFRPIEVVAPRGTIVNATFPHAVAAGNVETSQRIVDVVLGALSSALPDLVPAASQGTMNNLTLGGRGLDGTPFAYYETIGGGSGADPGGPGADGVHCHMTNTWNTPVEALELAYPLRVERYQIRRGSGGPGRHRGGDGLRRDVRVLVRAEGTLLAERRARGPYGLAGGGAGRPGRDRLIRAGRERPLPSKTHLELEAGDVVSIRTPGGGGWGFLREG